jgi:hypothetical protein
MTLVATEYNLNHGMIPVLLEYMQITEQSLLLLQTINSNTCFTTMPFSLNLHVRCMIQKFSLSNQPYMHLNVKTIDTQ